MPAPRAAGDGDPGRRGSEPGSRAAAAAGRLHFNRNPSRSRARWRRQGAASFLAAAGAEAAARLPPTARPPALRSPAHDLVGQQHAAHLRVLVLALVDDGLSGGKQRRRLSGAPALPSGRPGLAGRQVQGGRGRRRGPATPHSRRVARSGAGPRRPLLPSALRACARPSAGRMPAGRAGARPGHRESGRIGTDPGTRGCGPLGWRTASSGHCLIRAPKCVLEETPEDTLRLKKRATARLGQRFAWSSRPRPPCALPGLEQGGRVPAQVPAADRPPGPAAA